MAGQLIFYEDFTRAVNGETLLDLESPLYNITGQSYAQMYQDYGIPSGGLGDWYKTNTITVNGEGANWTGQTLHPINYQNEAWGARPIPRIPFTLPPNYGIAWSISVAGRSTFNYNNFYGQWIWSIKTPNPPNDIARAVVWDTGTLNRSQFYINSTSYIQDATVQYTSGSKMLHFTSIFNPNIPSFATTWSYNTTNSQYGGTATIADAAIDVSNLIDNPDTFLVPFDCAFANAAQNSSFTLQKIMIHTFPLDN